VSFTLKKLELITVTSRLETFLTGAIAFLIFRGKLSFLQGVQGAAPDQVLEVSVRT
jgi:hypothetical protein